MSEHDLTVRLNVDEAALAEHNKRAANGYGIAIPSDPSEWFFDDFAIALDNELLSGEIVDYNAVR